MKEFITNDNKLKEEDVTEIVKRVKVLIINSSNEVLLGYSHNDYQFPGGHVEDGETLLDTVNREVMEEVGINLNIKELEPFAKMMGYYKDWPTKGKNRKIEIYYYEVKTDEKPNLDNLHLTEHEKDGGFCLKYIPLEKIEEELINNINIYSDKHGITKEMLEVLEYYKKEKSKLKLENLKCVDNNIDLDKYINFYNKVKATMENTSWLGDFTKTDIEFILNNGGKIWIYYLNNDPVCSMMYIPSSIKSCQKLLDGKYDYREVIDYGPMMVWCDYFGNSLQYQMLEVLDEYSKNNGKKYAVSTVHPDNVYSINNLLKDDFKHIGTKTFTRGERNIYFKEL